MHKKQKQNEEERKKSIARIIENREKSEVASKMVDFISILFVGDRCPSLLRGQFRFQNSVQSQRKEGGGPFSISIRRLE